MPDDIWYFASGGDQRFTQFCAAVDAAQQRRHRWRCYCVSGRPGWRCLPAGHGERVPERSAVLSRHSDLRQQPYPSAFDAWVDEDECEDEEEDDAPVQRSRRVSRRARILRARWPVVSVLLRICQIRWVVKPMRRSSPGSAWMKTSRWRIALQRCRRRS